MTPDQIRAAFFQALMRSDINVATDSPAWPLLIQRRPLLVSGMTATFGPRIAILIDDRQDPEEAAIALWHEVLHVLLYAGGQRNHDEVLIESTARDLAKACPSILAWCGVPTIDREAT